MTTRDLIALGGLAILSTAACNRTEHQPAAVPIVNVAAEPDAAAQSSYLSAPSSDPLAEPAKRPRCVRDAAGQAYPLICAKAPDFSLERVAGTGPSTLSEARGQVIILTFCATFVAPCQRSLPAYHAIAQEHPGEVTVMIVMVDDGDDLDARESIKSMATTLKVSSPFLWDARGNAANVYSLHRLTLPSTVLIDQAGTLHSLYPGYHDSDEEIIRRAVKTLLPSSTP